MQQRLGFDLEIPGGFGHWLAGFTDGEGCFYVYAREYTKNGSDYRQCLVNFTIALRTDDLAILELIKSTLAIGQVYAYDKEYDKEVGNKKYHCNPQARFVVQRVPDLQHVLIPLFEQFPLRSKKGTDFEIWKQAVEIAVISTPGNKYRRGLSNELWSQFQRLANQLRKDRQYTPETLGRWLKQQENYHK